MPPYPSIMRGGCLFVSHGGGPMPLLGDPSHASMVKFLRGHEYRPSAVLLISAHWQTAVPTLTSGARPQLIYDYGGFPPESYQYTYAASGDGALAKRAASLLQTAGIASRLDESRGWDHGVFVPMMLMFPKADIPIVCLSLLNDPDPAKHFDLGRALRPLRDEGVLILGSGSSYAVWKSNFRRPTLSKRRYSLVNFHTGLTITWAASSEASPTRPKRRRHLTTI